MMKESSFKISNGISPDASKYNSLRTNAGAHEMSNGSSHGPSAANLGIIFILNKSIYNSFYNLTLSSDVGRSNMALVASGII
jgi:hypothetical protein